MIYINLTPNIKLQKFTSDEKFNVQHQNTNMDILDSEIKKLGDSDSHLASKESLISHTGNTDNPHKVTKEQLGLSNVVNRKQMYGIPTDVTTGGIPVFDGNGCTVKDSGFTIGKSVPPNAVFTDTVYSHPASNAAPGTYQNVTIDSGGHVTKGFNPTTLSGYGITDAANIVHTHTADEVSADSIGSAASALNSAKLYTDTAIINKVDKVDGMGLSQESFTTAEKNKLRGISEGAGTGDNLITGVKGDAETLYRTGQVSISKADIGLDKVENLTINDQMPVYTESTALSNITSGEKISSAFGKISKAISHFINHIGDTSKHFSLTNNLLATTTGTGLDAVQGKMLQGNINTEATARTNGDIALGKRVDATNKNVTENYQELFTDIAAARTLISGKMDNYNATSSGILTAEDISIAPNKRMYMMNASGGIASAARIYSPTPQALVLGASHEAPFHVCIAVVDGGWTLCPNVDALTKLGSASRRWAQIYSTVATISTSDAKLKQDVTDINYAEIKGFLKDLRPVFYRLIADPKKKYSGLIAQEVESAMIKHNISPDFGLLDKTPVYDEEGNVTDNYTYGLCYEQLIPLMLLVIQEEIL